ncbi:hypothetical protein HPB47_012226 [Ixodes persulcatus]|uniref:Uncharacterized protein n=1 Tax=Ixodes persulcatus TaxID=34615 RepID=A0AC60NU44_IXOPE|nr:hypothetical protein HPB47_012226 [Ixodes persulcatus]
MRSRGRSGVLPHPGGPEGSKPTPFPQTRESHAQPDEGGRARMARASPLGGTCEHDEACAFTVAHSFCNKRECTCRDGHEKEASKCVPTCTPTKLRE